MRRKRIAGALAGGAALSIVGIIPVSAHQGHSTCRAFGEETRTEAKVLRPFGELVRELVPVNDEIAAGHAVLCETTP